MTTRDSNWGKQEHERGSWRDEIQDRAELAGELADVLLYLLQLADVSGVNLVAAVRDKLQRNAGRVWDVEQA